MPIRPSQRDRYPKDWPAISRHIRLDRAHSRCECSGHCGCHHGWCGREDYGTSPETGARIILTVAHLDHTPENCRGDNLLAMCQRCHLAYDRDHHAQTRLKTQERQLLEAGQEFLPYDNLVQKGQ